MRAIHTLNASLYVANAVVWAFWAGSWSMAGLSLAAAGVAVVVAIKTDPWRY